MESVARAWPYNGREFALPVLVEAQAAPRTYYGVGDEVGKVASAAGDAVGELASNGGDEVGEAASSAEDGVSELAAGAGNTAPLDIFDLRCFWLCNSSSACCL